MGKPIAQAVRTAKAKEAKAKSAARLAPAKNAAAAEKAAKDSAKELAKLNKKELIKQLMEFQKRQKGAADADKGGLHLGEPSAVSGPA